MEKPDGSNEHNIPLSYNLFRGRGAPGFDGDFETMEIITQRVCCTLKCEIDLLNIIFEEQKLGIKLYNATPHEIHTEPHRTDATGAEMKEEEEKKKDCATGFMQMTFFLHCLMAGGTEKAEEEKGIKCYSFCLLKEFQGDEPELVI